MTKNKKRITRILISFLIFLFLFIAVELICNMLNSSFYRVEDDVIFVLANPVFEEDKYYLYKMRENLNQSFFEHNVSYITDENGWRIGFNKENYSDENFNILLIGDSTTFGWDVEYNQTYGFILKRLIEENYNLKVDLYNRAVPGYTSFQVRQVVNKEIKEIQPNIVIAYFGANDRGLAQYSDKKYYLSLNRKGIIKLIEKSNIYKLSRNIKKRIEYKKIYANLKQKSSEKDGIYSIADEIYDSNISLKIKEKHRVSHKDGWDNFNNISMTSRKYNASFIYIPHVSYINNEFVYPNKYNTSSFFDLVGELKKHPNSTLFLDIWHPNKYGHKIIGKALAVEIGKIIEE